VTLAIFSSCVCCFSYVGLCCGLPSWAKILGTIGFAIVAVTFTIFIVWLGGGVYLVIRFDKLALFTDVCRNLLAYVVLLVVYVVTVFLVGVVWCVWRVRDSRRRERTTTRQRLDTTPKLLRV
jgi:Na+/melibiose symporter-like transporter